MIVVEDGSNVSGANSYVTVSELTSYAIARGVTLTTDAERLIVNAMDYLESLNFVGYKYNETQPLQWPRGNVYIDGYYVGSDSIPQALKDAQMAICLEKEAGNDQLSTIERETISETVGSISVTYKTGSSSAPLSRAVNAKLKKLLANSGGLYLVR